MIIDLESAIKYCEEEEEKQKSKAHVFEDVVVLNQAIKHNSEAEYYEELVNECVDCAKEYHQFAKWLKKLQAYEEGIGKIKEQVNNFKGCDMWDMANGMELALELLEVKDEYNS